MKKIGVIIFPFLLFMLVLAGCSEQVAGSRLSGQLRGVDQMTVTMEKTNVKTSDWHVEASVTLSETQINALCDLLDAYTFSGESAEQQRVLHPKSEYSYTIAATAPSGLQLLYLRCRGGEFMTVTLNYAEENTEPDAWFIQINDPAWEDGLNKILSMVQPA